MDRKTFIKASALLGATTLLPSSELLATSEQISKEEKISKTPFKKISEVDKPLAIAMWDFSWILCHHRYGSFENWEEVLQGLALRGYNAIRIDAMPQFVVSEKDGTIIEEFRSIVDTWTPPMWGNQFSMDFRPREALLEFLPLCKEYGIQVGLASWFLSHSVKRDIFTEEGGLLRAWSETLDFLKENNLLDNIIYVDLLNEYPNVHGYDWLKMELDKCSDVKSYKLNNPNAHIPENLEYNQQTQELRRAVYNKFSSELCGALSKRFPQLDFFVSYDSAIEHIDLTNQKALDYHKWFHHRGDMPSLDKIGSRELDCDWRQLQNDLDVYWKDNKDSLVKWLDETIDSVAKKARENGVVCGNTEGWGAILWIDHPDLSWDFIKESAHIAIDMSKKHPEYKFICTSNFTHPHFKGIWEDIEWHKRLTSIIKS